MDNQKLEVLYRQYRGLVLDVAYNVLVDFYLAQDVCQEVFVKLSQIRIEKAALDDETRNYMCVVAKRRAMDCKKMVERRREDLMGDMRDFPQPEYDIDHKVCIELFAEEMFQALLEKNEQWYEIVVRLDVYDEEKEIVARDMNISYGLLRTKYHRARNWLIKNYKDQYESIKWN